MERLPIFDMFYSIQGEGEYMGMPAFFIRLAGCNVGCDFCDEKRAWKTDYGTMTEVSQIIEDIEKSKAKNIIITGGEPSLYDLTFLTKTLKDRGSKTFLETSGVNIIRGVFFHVTLSPKKNKLPLIQAGKENGKSYFVNNINSLKVVIEQEKDFLFAEQMAALVKEKNRVTFFLQPEWTKRKYILPKIVEYVKQNNMWRVSLQMHKYMNIK